MFFFQSQMIYFTSDHMTCTCQFCNSTKLTRPLHVNKTGAASQCEQKCVLCSTVALNTLLTPYKIEHKKKPIVNTLS